MGIPVTVMTLEAPLPLKGLCEEYDWMLNPEPATGFNTTEKPLPEYVVLLPVKVRGTDWPTGRFPRLMI